MPQVSTRSGSRVDMDEAFLLFRGGASLTSLGRRYGVARQRVEQVLAEHPGYEAARIERAERRAAERAAKRAAYREGVEARRQARHDAMLPLVALRQAGASWKEVRQASGRYATSLSCAMAVRAYVRRHGLTLPFGRP